MVKERRCNLFDDHGRPRRLTNGKRGCTREAPFCHFAHPNDREWNTANPSMPPRHELVADDDSDFYYILIHQRGSERPRKSSSDAHRESSPHRKDSMTSPRSRRSTFDNAIDSSNSRPAKSRSPAHSTTSDQLEKLRKDRDDKYHRRDYPPRRDYDSSRRSRSRSRERGKERVDPLRKSSPVRSHANVDGRVPAPPPEPSKPPPMQPPLPHPKLPEVPREPSFMSNQQAGSVSLPPKGLKALSMDEQRKAWHERIDLMFTSISSRRDYTKLESDLAHIRVLSSSSLVDSMPEAKRAHINEQKMALELQMEKKRKEINETIQKLIGSEFWPVLRAPQVLELEKGLGEVKKHVLEVKSVLDDLKSSCAALLKTRAESVPASDLTQDSDRPSKRRKLGGDADPSRKSVMPEDATKELEAFRDKLSAIEGHITNLENDIVQRDQVISDEIDLLITARLEEEDALYPPVTQLPEVPQSEIEAVVDAKNKELNHAVSVTGEEIGLLAVEVAELITKVNDLEARCRALEAENEEIKNKLAQETPNLAIPESALTRREKEIEAIAAALQAYISQAPTTQPSSDLPSAEYIIEALDGQLDGIFREKFCATLVKIQQEVFDKVQESHDHTLNTLSPKIMLLLKMVNLITARVGKPDMDAINE